MLSKMTLIGLNDYSEGTIWNDIELPEGVDKDILISEILREAAEFPLLYPDENYMKYQIKNFFKKWLHNFTKWWEVYNTAYNPLYNVDVKTVTEEHGVNAENSTTENSGKANTTTTGQKSAYDSDTFQNSDKQITNTGTSGKIDVDSDSSHDVTTTEIKQGNQGVTMTQEMWLMETDMWYWNFYKHIAEIFVNEFCICIYM